MMSTLKPFYFNKMYACNLFNIIVWSGDQFSWTAQGAAVSAAGVLPFPFNLKSGWKIMKYLSSKELSFGKYLSKDRHDHPPYRKIRHIQIHIYPQTSIDPKYDAF